MSTGTLSSIPIPINGPSTTKLQKQKRDTLTCLNNEIWPAYQSATGMQASVPWARNVLIMLNLTCGECEELEMTAERFT